MVFAQTIFLFILFSFSLCGEQNEKTRYESLTGLSGTYNDQEKVFKASFPRTDVAVSVDGTPLTPFRGLTTWVAFTPASKEEYLMMGDLVLFEDEVNPVMTSLLNHNVGVTALHNHFFFDNPKVYFMHVNGMGSLTKLGDAIKGVMDLIRQIRVKDPKVATSFGGTTPPDKSTINVKPLEAILGMPAQSMNGIVKFVIGRKAKMGDVEVGKEMGVNSWIALYGENSNVVADGDIVVPEHMLQSVLKKLRSRGISIVAIHNHMTMETPRLIFLHFWGKGEAITLAKTFKEAHE